MTAAAGRLPGLAAVLAEALGSEGSPVVLGADAAARTALMLAGSIGRTRQPAEHLSRALPLPPRSQSAAGSTVKRTTPKLADI